MQAKELALWRFCAHAAPISRSREQTLIMHNAPNRRPADREMELGQFPDDPAVAPTDIRPCKLDDEPSPHDADERAVSE